MQKEQRNREMMFVTYFFVILFLFLMVYLVYLSLTGEEEMINNNYNPRQQMLAEQNTRGDICSADGEILAQSVLKDGTTVRDYPYKELFAHVVGYLSKGKAGLEKQENYALIHSDIAFSKKAANEKAGRKNPGNTVYTTLDTRLQKVASDSLGVYKGAVIVSNPKTGEILAMVSKPSFDPNEIDIIWDDIVQDNEKGVLLNRVTQGIYPPGSTFKIVTALEYIRENPDTYQNFSYQCSGKYEKDGETINCYHKKSHGKVDLYEAFAKSCNASFASIGMELSKEKFQETIQGLLFQEDLPVLFPYNKSNVFLDEFTTDAQMMQIVIGQGKTQMTPLHLNMLTCAIGNEGKVMVPYLVDRVESDDAAYVKQNSPSVLQEIMTKEEAAVLKKMMEEVVLHGTATKLSGMSYTAAGKTGSAEFNKIKEDSHAWFTGFAPVDDPQIAVTMIIEGAGSGGEYAVPVAKRIFDAYFKLN